MVRRSSSKNKVTLSKRGIIGYESKESNSPSQSDESTKSTSMTKKNKSKKSIVYCSNIADETHSSVVINSTMKSITSSKILEAAPTKYQWGFPGHLTKSELSVFNKFRDEVHRRGGPFRETVFSFGEAEDESYALCRWLRARKFNYSNVMKMVEEATECRSNASKHNFYPNPSDGLGNNVEKSIYLAQYPQSYAAYSKDGYPVLFSKPGVLNINGLESITNLDGIFNFHWWAMIHDFGDKLRYQASNNPNFKRFECICILDMGNLTSTQNLRRALNIIKVQTQVDSLCFPETLNKMIVINAPSFFSMTWNIISSWFDERTAKKIEIISSTKKWESRLKDLIDIEQLPSDYGGKGCSTIQAINDDMMKEDGDDCKKRLISKFMSVRSSATYEFELNKSEVVNDISIFTRSTSGATVSIKGNAARINVVHKGKGDDTDVPSRVYLPIQNPIVGPGKFIVKVDSNSSALSTDNFFIVGRIKTCDVTEVKKQHVTKAVNKTKDQSEVTRSNDENTSLSTESTSEEGRSDDSKRNALIEVPDCESRELSGNEHQVKYVAAKTEALVKDEENIEYSHPFCCGMERIMDILPFRTICS